MAHTWCTRTPRADHQRVVIERDRELANYRSGNLPQIGKLAVHEFSNELTHLQLQLIEVFSLHLMVGIALEMAAPFALILPHHKLGNTHAAECIGKVTT